MIDLPEFYRVACPDDAVAMAELVNMAGEGLPHYLWSGMSLPGQDPWEVGQERARREGGSFSYRNTVVREEEGKVIACLIGYPLEDNPEPADYRAVHSNLPLMFVPLQQLEDQAPGSWYVNVLATYPEYRGRGYGRELLAIAEAIARDGNKGAMSIIVADSNQGARKLYESMGYTERARRPMVKESWQNSGVNWVLLLKEL